MGDKTAEKQLNRLLHRNYDAEKGYSQVAKHVNDPDLTAFFLENSEERYRFGHEIKGIMADQEYKIDKGSTIEGDMHRVWLNIKKTFAKNSEKAIVEEAIRGEEYAIDDYRDAIANENLLPKHKAILSDHLQAIENSKLELERLKRLVKT